MSYNKYKNSIVKCFFGHSHKSIYEAKYCFHLSLLQRAGEFQKYTPQQKYDLHCKTGEKVCSHIPDFTVVHNDGSIEVRECKERGNKFNNKGKRILSGTVKEIWLLKKKWFEKEYPEIKYTVIWRDECKSLV